MATVTATYKCKQCGKTFERDVVSPPKQWYKSYCEWNGKWTRVWLQPPTPAQPQEKQDE